MSVEKLIKNLDNMTAEEFINGIDTDPAYEPLEADTPIYTDYDTDIDLVKKFKVKLNLPDNKLDVINNFLNKKAYHYDGERKKCPKCGKQLDLVGNDGHFCKFCGTHLKRETSNIFETSLKEIRKERGLGQTEIGKMMDTSAAYVCKLEKGNKIPSEEDLQKLSNIFQCSVNLFFGQDAPRFKTEGALTYQENLPSMDKKAPVVKEDFSGYEIEDSEIIFTCPHCGEEIDLTPMESLSLSLTAYESMRLRTHGNDGNYCKHCGQGITRPVKIDEDKAFSSYRYWIDFAKKRCHI